ncbi:hypothetical protein, partial [Burkholderia humptydooensis]|uniref:hypothetical protein n=1 Tax=Burkholderia humptydooensis TaxID=430531 RepID=UPI001E38D4AD
ICEKISPLSTAFSAALRCQQQRNEIMITYSQRVNTFLPPRHRNFIIAVSRFRSSSRSTVLPKLKTSHSPLRAAFAVARKRRDSMHIPSLAQALFERKFL